MMMSWSSMSRATEHLRPDPREKRAKTFNQINCSCTENFYLKYIELFPLLRAKAPRFGQDAGSRCCHECVLAENVNIRSSSADDFLKTRRQAIDK